MKRLMLLAGLGAGLALAGCEEPAPQQAELPPPPLEEPMAPAATDQTAPVVTTAPTDQPPVDTLPPEKRSSEETVQPESETLFY